MRYIYLSDKLGRLLRPDLAGRACDPIRRPDGKVVRGRNRNQLVRFAGGEIHVVAGRHLRLSDKQNRLSSE